MEAPPFSLSNRGAPGVVAALLLCVSITPGWQRSSARKHPTEALTVVGDASSLQLRSTVIAPLMPHLTWSVLAEQWPV